MHTEVIVTNNNDVHIVETHLRMGGDKIPELIELASGFDLLHTWCKQIVDGSINWDNIPEITADNTKHFAAIRFFVADKGIVGHQIKEVCTDWIQLHPDICECSVYLKKGDMIPENTDSFSRLGHIILCNDSYNVVNDLSDKLVCNRVVIAI